MLGLLSQYFSPTSTLLGLLSVHSEVHCWSVVNKLRQNGKQLICAPWELVNWFNACWYIGYEQKMVWFHTDNISMKVDNSTVRKHFFLPTYLFYQEWGTVVLPLTQRKQVMANVFFCADLPKGWHSKHRACPRLLCNTPSRLVPVQEEVLSIWR